MNVSVAEMQYDPIDLFRAALHSSIVSFNTLVRTTWNMFPNTPFESEKFISGLMHSVFSGRLDHF